MKKMYLMGMIAIGFFLYFIPTNAYADFVKFNMRCSEDSLSPNEATERIEWATKCGYITADDRIDALFSAGHNPRPKPLYPLFSTADLASIWKAPVDRNAPCTIPSGFQVMGFCTSSCYTPDQVLLFPEGFVPIKEAKEKVIPEVMTLSDKATLDSPALKVSNVESYTEEVRNTTHDILHFKMQRGGELKVTKNHPLVDSEGRVRTADSFKVGEKLVHFEYGPEVIESITPMHHYGKVYNITPKSDSLLGNIVVAQGYLSGSAYYQNDGVNYLNRKLLRRTIPEELLK